MANRYIVSSEYFWIVMKNKVGFSDISGITLHLVYRHLKKRLSIMMICFLFMLNYWTPSPAVQLLISNQTPSYLMH